MRILKFLATILVTILLTIVLDNRWVISGTPVPPLGKLLNPFHGFWANLEPDELTPPDPEAFTALNSDVSVVYDSLGVPRIFAGDDLDLYFAQGYVTARDRLWQMEFMTHAAAGRVSEIAGAGPGDAILDYDRGQRRLGMTYGAKRALEAIRQNQNAMLTLEKYTEGINAYISSLAYRSLPFEYKLLDYRPEPWTPLKCALLMKSMAQSLCMSEKDMEMSNALKLFGIEAIDLLYPDREDVGDPVVSNPGTWKATATLPDSVSLAVPADLIRVSRLQRADPGVGSNNWAVSGEKTETGYPILAGDPHLNLSMPAIWYLIQLHAPGVNVFGVSLPGAPGVVFGSTNEVAWSETNAQRDLVDWYAMKFKDSTQSEYELDGKWMSAEKQVEVFHVRDRGDVHDTVTYTVWGPVTYDRRYHANNDHNGYAFRWIAHDPSHEFEAIYKLNRIRSIADFDSALRLYSNPALNFAVASTSGDIGMRIAGTYPVRRANEGRFVLDGSRRDQGWQRFIPFEDYVVSINPTRGFVSSANQYPVDSTYPYYITARRFEAYRNRRINQQLSAVSKATVNDMMKLQTDNFSLMAFENLPWMLALLDTSQVSPEALSVAKELAAWDRVNAAESTSASYFALWIQHILSLAWDEMDEGQALLERPSTFTTLRLLHAQPHLPFFDIRSTPEKEDATSLVRMAFLKAIQEIDAWRSEHNLEPRLTDVKASRINHLLRIGPLGNSITGGGSADAVNALSKTHGPSWRMIVSLEPGNVRIWGTYPGGQSGNPGSRLYDNLIPSWEQGRYYMWQMTEDPAGVSNALYTLQMTKD